MSDIERKERYREIGRAMGVQAVALSDLQSKLDAAAAEIERLRAENERLRDAVAPFAAMGRVMETRARVTLGKVPKDSEIVCESSGEAGMGILTMGHFRDAAALLPNAPGWGGIYRPLERQALQETDSDT